MGNNPHACHPPRWMLATSQPGDHYYGSQTSQHSSYAETSGPPEAIYSITSTPTATSPARYGQVSFEETIPPRREDPYTPISNYSDRPVASAPSPPYNESSRQATVSVPFTDNSHVANYVPSVRESPKSVDTPERWHGWQATPDSQPAHVHYNQYTSPTTSSFPITPQQEQSSKLPLSTVEPINKKQRRDSERTGANPPSALHPHPSQRPKEIPRARGGSTYFKDEAARQRALERNREAANRCRHRQRDQATALASLEYEVEDHHKYLSEYLQSLNNEVLNLKTELLRHTNCNCALIQTYLGYEAIASVNSMVGVFPSYGTSAASSTVECLGLQSPGTSNGPSHWPNPHQPPPAIFTSADHSLCADLVTTSDVIDSIKPTVSNTTQLPPQHVFSVSSSAYTTTPGVHRQSPYNSRLWGPQ
ncbi:unnamed protein product [Clonostachys rosea]|uniref:BZIP domain-containing protein n=1 Tax=Bionectria ochroleuca TaxID=29856 RepID=A0ABY6TVR3_BIOOC|nr:unnamed protein product [Clonostachys rosea]